MASLTEETDGHPGEIITHIEVLRLLTFSICSGIRP